MVLLFRFGCVSFVTGVICELLELISPLVLLAQDDNIDDVIVTGVPVDCTDVVIPNEVVVIGMRV